MFPGCAVWWWSGCEGRGRVLGWTKAMENKLQLPRCGRQLRPGRPRARTVGDRPSPPSSVLDHHHLRSSSIHCIHSLFTSVYVLHALRSHNTEMALFTRREARLLISLA